MSLGCHATSRRTNRSAPKLGVATPEWQVPSDPHGTESGVPRNPDDTAAWLQVCRMSPESALQEKLGEAIGLAAEELRFGSGVVHFIVQASGWNPFTEVVVYRAPEPGLPVGLHILSLNAFESALWRPPYSVDLTPDLRRRHRSPVLILLRRAEIMEPVAPTTWDLMLHVASRVRQRMAEIERI